MNLELTTERLFQTLITGDRCGTRTIIEETRQAGIRPEDRAHELYWPVLEMINQLYRADQLALLAHHYATRLLRSLVDQAQSEYTQEARCGKRVLMFCGSGDTDDLAGQLAADLLEAAGYEVYFSGSGVANDELLAEVGQHRPDTLLMFGSAPSDAPNIRQLIDSVRGVGANPGMQFVVGGGVFNRAEGLAEEIGADLWAKTPFELIEKLRTQADRRAMPEQRTVGRNRRTASAA